MFPPVVFTNTTTRSARSSYQFFDIIVSMGNTSAILHTLKAFQNAPGLSLQIFSPPKEIFLVNGVTRKPQNLLTQIPLADSKLLLICEQGIFSAARWPLDKVNNCFSDFVFLIPTAIDRTCTLHFKLIRFGDIVQCEGYYQDYLNVIHSTSFAKLQTTSHSTKALTALLAEILNYYPGKPLVKVAPESVSPFCELLQNKSFSPSTDPISPWEKFCVEYAATQGRLLAKTFLAKALLYGFFGYAPDATEGMRHLNDAVAANCTDAFILKGMLSLYGSPVVSANEKEAALIFSDARFGDPAYAGTEVALLHTHLPYALAGSFKDCLSLFNHYVRQSKDCQKARFWIEKAESATSVTDSSQRDQLATCKAILEKKLNPPRPQEKEPLPATDPSCPSTNNAECKSRPNRLIFVLLGLPLGFIGLHFLYARRKNLFLITLLAGAFAVCEYLHLTSWLSPRETALCAMTNLFLWLGGAIFVKCDGYKRVMPWW